MTVRPVHLAAVFLLLLLSLLASLVLRAAPASGTEELEPTPSVHLFTYPRGPTPELISDLSPGCCGEREYAGFAALGPGDEIYFYDLDFNNIKVIDSERGTLLRLIEGPRSYNGGLYPEDMAVADDGTITLVIQHPQSLDFRKRSMDDTGWVRLGNIASSALGLDIVPGSYRLDAGPDGTAYIYFSYNNRSLPVDRLAALASENRLSEAWELGIRGRVGADGFFYPESGHQPDGWGHEQTAEDLVSVRDRNGTLVKTLPGIAGAITGVSRDGFLGFKTMRGLVLMGPSGEIIGSCPYFGRTERMLSGRGSFLVSSTGRIYSLGVTTRGLEAYLSTGGK